MKTKKIIKGQNRILRYFIEALSYTKLNRKYIYFAAYIFIFFIILGLVLPTPDFIQVQIQNMIKELAEKTANLNIFELILFIFKNNFSVAFIGLFLGLIFCFVPILLAVSNGYVLGYVVKVVIFKLGISAGIISLWKLLPHGIFEIPAILISLGLGIKLGVVFIKSLNEGSFKKFLSDFLYLLKVFICVIFPLLLIAAIIEGSLIHLLG
jgi:stage II sporulation protein M